MKFIPIMEISSQIMTLIDEAERQLTIVSPYVEISKWDKVKNCLERAKKRNVDIVFYVRENTTNNLEPLYALGIQIVLIKNLHAKIYLNESYGIVSSQNLTHFSDSHSIDFGYRTETDEEMKQLRGMIKKYMSVADEPTEIRSSENPAKVVRPAATTTEIKYTEFDFTAIKEAFDRNFAAVKCNQTSSYVYCEQLLPIADIMLREGFEIRFHYGITERDPIFIAMKQIVFKNNHHQYKLSHVGGINGIKLSMMLKPQNVNDMQKLIFDYIFIAKTFKEATKNIEISKPKYF